MRLHDLNNIQQNVSQFDSFGDEEKIETNVTFLVEIVDPDVERDRAELQILGDELFHVILEQIVNSRKNVFDQKVSSWKRKVGSYQFYQIYESDVFKGMKRGII